MTTDVRVQELTHSEWERLRSLRLASLDDSPHAFGGDHAAESAMTAEAWIDRMANVRYFAAVVQNVDSAIMSVEQFDGDFGAKIWLGGCWVAPQVRGTGVMKAFINFIDSVATERGWERQGLGVWHDNHLAIAAYERLGFKIMGDMQESTRKPGLYYQRMIRDTVTSV